MDAKAALAGVLGEAGYQAFKPCCWTKDLKDMAHIPLPNHAIALQVGTARNKLNLNAPKLHARCTEVLSQAGCLPTKHPLGQERKPQ